MKTIGLIGGMSWESTQEYYRIMNEAVKSKLGGLHSAKLVLYSVDFEEIKELQYAGRWDRLTELMVQAAQSIEAAGAEMVVLCTNTMHKMADEVQSRVQIPLLHIADATAAKITAQGIRKIGLLGTSFTMEQDFYKGRLQERFGLEVVVPKEEDRRIVHEIIYEELCKGVIRSESKARYLEIIGRLVDDGAEGVILGCTEITLLIHQADCGVPVFDTARIHALQAVDAALAK
ncbi:aspartate/glutamate racemase family protein [Paenibacillus turpanensis]|uniref:aspartate/glutamate racemase family protein n=1 Tax=Paenibacillus turpanensis TaxID=2689078 RepID=UPI00140D6A9C|nr:aspartate/glutamate racemase family protein [Paenibacillus turpanensis]